MPKYTLILLLLGLAVALAPATAGAVALTGQASEGAATAALSGTADGNVAVAKGLRVQFDIESAAGAAEPVRAGEYAEVRFTITDEATGAPVSPLEPAVWINSVEGQESGLSCRERIGRYLQGMLSYQADIDLNKYFILIMNNDRTIAVVDPLLGVSGITQLYGMIFLKDRGEDWVYSPDGKRLFVSMPGADSLAVVDLDNFKVIANVAVGPNPVRVALQPDGSYLWVGNDARTGDGGGVTVVDTRTYRVAARIPTGAGHQEIAFTDDSLHAFVTSSFEGSVAVIDTQQLKMIKQLPVGKSPVAVQFSPLSKAAYVASEGDGTVTVVDGTRLETVSRIATGPGLISLRAAPGGRWLFAANIERDRVDVIDVTGNRIAHRFPVGDQPHQFAFTDTYAYVRHLGTPDVKLIPLAQLERKETVALHSVALGSRNPGDYPATAIADSISPTGEWTAVVAANPADKMVYYYMEGMIGPMGSYSTYGRVPRAVGVVDRSVSEIAKGVYAAKIRVPRAGGYNVAFIIDSPLVDQCFSFTAAANPALEAAEVKRPVRLEFVDIGQQVAVGEPVRVTFSLTGADDQAPLTGLQDVLVIATRMPGNWQERLLARPTGEGRYAVSLVPDREGVYLISVGIPSLQMDVTELPYRSFRAVAPKASKNTN